MSVCLMLYKVIMKVLVHFNAYRTPVFFHGAIQKDKFVDKDIEKLKD